MKDGIIKGQGNSRLLKAPATIPNTFAEFRTALINGTLPVDMLFNAAGWDVIGTALNKANLLTDVVAAALGLEGDDPTVSEAINALMAVATQQKNGLMSSTDKAKLDGVAAGANNYVHPTADGYKHIPAAGAADNILGYSAVGTAQWIRQLAIKALIEAANQTAYGITNVDAALALLRPARHYGKRSQMNGGTAHSATAGRGVMSFETEVVDDFNAINLGSSASRITIPAGITKAKFYFSGNVYATNSSGSIRLYKNGAEVYNMLGFSHSDENFYGAGNNAIVFSPIVDCAAGNYFEIFADTNGSGQPISSVNAGSMFGMEACG
ncbi:MAG: hypothetical protein PHE79_04715 [Eubacteriales bacterium]|nr:hypothetical protein [Eubacteriales bacterium]